MTYLGRGVTAATILRTAADQGRRLGAPIDMVQRFEAAATVYASTGVYPSWAAPVQTEKRAVFSVLREEDHGE
jgi:hypothetical protein